MKTREELLRNDAYWTAKIQTELFSQVNDYLKKNPKGGQTLLAKKIGKTKGYISQILNGNFDHKISKLAELSIAIGKAPIISYYDLEEYIHTDKIGHAQEELGKVFLNFDLQNPIENGQSTEEIEFY